MKVKSLMILEFPKQAREDAVNSVKKYCDENMPEPIGDLAAGLLLDSLSKKWVR